MSSRRGSIGGDATSENKIFAKYGHDCTLEDIGESYDWTFYPGFSLWAKFRRFVFRLVVVSDSSKFCTHHLRSFGALSKERRRQLSYHPFTIHPFSLGRIVWAVIMVLTSLYLLMTYPFHYLLFDFEDVYVFSLTWQILAFIANMFLALNILVNFLTGYYDEPQQQVVLDLRKIAIHYLKTSFLIDAVSAIPSYWTSVLSDQHLVSYLLFFSLFKLLLVINFSKYSKILANFYDINYYNYMSTMVIFYMFLFWHIMSCIVEFIKVNITYYTRFRPPLFPEIKDELKVGERNVFDVWATYINAVHQRSLLFYNAGYGSIPGDEGEIVMIYSVWYGSSLFCILILAMIMEINTGRTSSAHKYDEMERQLQEYMRHRQLPSYMRTRILTYYEFKFQKRYFRENEILATISEQLRQEMNLHACRKLVENVIFFRNLPLNLLVRIISCLRIEVFLVNDVIIRANTPGASMYFISTGTVAIYTKSGKEVCHLEDGAHFGEVALLIKDTFRIASVIAVEVSEIYRLDQKDFVKAINPYPDLLANIQHIAEERMEVSSMLDEYNKREQAASRTY